MGLATLASCSLDSIDYPDRFQQTDGVPTIHYVRYADRDLIITQANMEENICIVGDNLTSVHDIYFNDQPAVLNTRYMTEHAIVVTVPKNLPKVQDDKMHLITRDSSVVLYDFRSCLRCRRSAACPTNGQIPATRSPFRVPISSLR